jgi:hypothetical protein
MLLAALLGLQGKAGPLVQVDPSGAGGAVAVVEGHRPLKDIVVLCVVGDGGVGSRDAENIAEFRKEQLIVGSFGG